ncbi:hypothetical protein B0H14DRAFT_2612829 [Mycena olivaceomarginata]|nr:hypothetical protein B0H14DRAFT_2612829 [Mycena olivaceomarginata]
MFFKLATLASLLSVVAAGINLGILNNNGDHVAWFSGHPKSDYTDIGPPYFQSQDKQWGGPLVFTRKGGARLSTIGSIRTESTTPNASASPSQMPLAFILSSTAPRLVQGGNDA